MRSNIPPIERCVGIVAILIVLFAAATFVGQEAVPSEIGRGDKTIIAQATDEKASAEQPAIANETEKPAAVDQADERIKKIEELLVSTEIRSYENKLMARQLIRNTRWQIGILLVIAVLLAASLWVLGRQRALPRSDLSAEMATTLVAVEERQAKLANILKDIQQEIDYVHSMSVPDLKKLIEQAERYIEQNEKDLARASTSKKQAGPTEAAKPER
ncbi:MAG: hypothetical protein LDL33_03050 [Desulfomonile sp.]|nr:hypothetical protein [Desulfomonile sp.]